MNNAEIHQVRLLLNGTLNNIQIMYSVGIAVLTEHFRVVSQLLICGTPDISLITDKRARYKAKEEIREAQESLVFLEGTGIHVVVEAYNLGMNADQLQDAFFSHCDHAKGCQNHSNKSA